MTPPPPAGTPITVPSPSWRGVGRDLALSLLLIAIGQALLLAGGMWGFVLGTLVSVVAVVEAWVAIIEARRLGAVGPHTLHYDLAASVPGGTVTLTLTGKRRAMADRSWKARLTGVRTSRRGACKEETPVHDGPADIVAVSRTPDGFTIVCRVAIPDLAPAEDGATGPVDWQVSLTSDGPGKPAAIAFALGVMAPAALSPRS